MTDQPSAPSIEPLRDWLDEPDNGEGSRVPIKAMEQALAAYDLKCGVVDSVKRACHLSDVTDAQLVEQIQTIGSKWTSELAATKQRADRLEVDQVKLRSALAMVQEQEKRGYLSYCGINTTKKVVDEALESTKSTFTHARTVLYENKEEKL